MCVIESIEVLNILDLSKLLASKQQNMKHTILVKICETIKSSVHAPPIVMEIKWQAVSYVHE